MTIMKAALLTASATAFTAASIKQRASRTLLRAESALETLPEGENPYTIAIFGDLHVDPRDTEHLMEGREHMKATNPDFLVSLGDLGESKDCTETKQLYAGTTECFKLVRDYFDGFGVPFDVVGGNHDLEGIDEFDTDQENLEVFMKIMGKETPQFCHEVAPKTLLVGLGSTVFRDATYTSHEVFVDAEQVAWFENLVATHPAEEDWKIFCFSHAPPIGSGLRVLQENHVVNGCCWLNHNGGPGAAPQRFIETIRKNSQVKAWFSGHFHLSHDYEDSITFPGGNNRGSCVFAQTGCHSGRSSRDGRRHSRLVRGNEHGFEICTVDHSKGGVVRLDATVTYSDECAVDGSECSTLVFAHDHEDYDHDLWFQAYTPQEDDGCYIANPDGTINPAGSKFEDLSNPETVCWSHMKDGAVLGAHNGMIIEYDPSTLAPLGMVVSRDELKGRRVAVIDNGHGGSACVLYDDDNNSEVTVVQPNEDGTYWRKVVRNKMHRTREMRNVAAAKEWIKEVLPDQDHDVMSSYGPYTSTAGQVMGISTKALPFKEDQIKEKIVTKSR
ncbi:hypothetical protein SO694_00005470 [Aureococcus anophagefferens]|uniref:Calcineurin-like phosphoesterase domain-containing protein n=1 Tax=Aureococcus anophagefferens TaxID=44056 RepID=A0ABR1G9W8_AURAN